MWVVGAVGGLREESVTGEVGGGLWDKVMGGMGGGGIEVWGEEDERGARGGGEESSCGPRVMSV